MVNGVVMDVDDEQSEVEVEKEDEEQIARRKKETTGKEVDIISRSCHLKKLSSRRQVLVTTQCTVLKRSPPAFATGIGSVQVKELSSSAWQTVLSFACQVQDSWEVDCHSLHP